MTPGVDTSTMCVHPSNSDTKWKTNKQKRDKDNTEETEHKSLENNIPQTTYLYE